MNMEKFAGHGVLDFLVDIIALESVGGLALNK
jgi:hypothetical protein